MQIDYQIRELTTKDESIVWEMLRYAAQQPSIASVRSQPYLARYAADWGRYGDCGYVASQQGIPIGAAWLRLWLGERGFGYVNDETPELGLAVLPDYRGRGIGPELLDRVLQSARERFAGVSLSVRSDNPVLRLYERSGFVKAAGSEHLNRADSISFTMICKFE
jgi:ribosomal protein S18 acetylase RimI-like enzyme